MTQSVGRLVGQMDGQLVCLLVGQSLSGLVGEPVELVGQLLSSRSGVGQLVC